MAFRRLVGTQDALVSVIAAARNSHRKYDLAAFLDISGTSDLAW